MVEPLVVEGAYPDKGSRLSTTRTSFFNVYLALSSLCAVVGLIIAAISLQQVNELAAFKSSHFITDLENTFNTTVYAISADSKAQCHDFTNETVTGQTSIPGQCVTVTPSSNMYVTRRAHNCHPYAYGQENCTGNRTIVPVVNPPDCVYYAPAGWLDGREGDIYKSFQVLCH